MHMTLVTPVDVFDQPTSGSRSGSNELANAGNSRHCIVVILCNFAENGQLEILADEITSIFMKTQ